MFFKFLYSIYPNIYSTNTTIKVETKSWESAVKKESAVVNTKHCQYLSETAKRFAEQNDLLPTFIYLF